LRRAARATGSRDSFGACNAAAPQQALRRWSLAMFMRVLLLAVALGLATTAAALEVAGVTLPEKSQVAGRELVLNGAGLRKRAIFKVYVGSLYLPQKAMAADAVLAQAPRRVRLDVLRDLSADQLIGALDEGLKANTTAAEYQSLATPLGEMAAIMKSFGQAKEGSVVTLDFIDGGTHIGLDGTERGTIAGEAFNAALTRIWVGEHPVQEDLKKAMLGGA
jgi:long-chain acyl-CoA synthetase